MKKIMEFQVEDADDMIILMKTSMKYICIRSQMYSKVTPFKLITFQLAARTVRGICGGLDNCGNNDGKEYL